MRFIAGFIVGAALTCAATQWRKPVAWLLTRVPPATHPDCAPRFKINGVEVASWEPQPAKPASVLASRT